MISSRISAAADARAISRAVQQSNRVRFSAIPPHVVCSTRRSLSSYTEPNEPKTIVTDAGVPYIPGYHSTNQDPQHLLSEAQKIGALTRSTVVSRPHDVAGAERLHFFSGGHAATVLCRAPAWAEALSADAHLAARGALCAPMPSLVVEVSVAVGEYVEKGQAVVVLESLKTETALRAPADGVVRAVGCIKGEMVEEGRELVDIEESEE